LYRWVDGRPSGGGAGSSPALWERVLRVEENKIEEAEEHQQVTAEVRLHWVGVQGECGRRSTVV
jgi:hypothetical protein